VSCPALAEPGVGVRSPDPMIPRTELDKECRARLRAEGPKSAECVMNEGCETPSTVERGFENRCESAESPEKCREPIVCVLFVCWSCAFCGALVVRVACGACACDSCSNICTVHCTRRWSAFCKVRSPTCAPHANTENCTLPSTHRCCA
jgi:hypothetical protein